MSLSVQPLSPLDGRYREAVSELGAYLSEAGLNHARVTVEIEWLIHLASIGAFGTSITDAEKTALREVIANFGDDDVARIAHFEATTRHDVKAVEYLVREHLERLGLGRLAELTHFACTSEDINNLSYGITLNKAVRTVWRPAVDQVLSKLTELAREYRDAPMLARTHGQPATPTTFGKELAVFVHRLTRLVASVDEVALTGKFSGATGTFSAHYAAAPEIDWISESRAFVTHLGLEWNPLTTQIESHDTQAQILTRIAHVNRVLHNLCTDVWTYISLGYLTQIPVAGATGSSTMPHKVNPIRFENAEANLELSNALCDSLASTLVTSRMQRDLTDSTTQRNFGVALGHAVLALSNIHRGLHEVSLNREALLADLGDNIEVLGEAIQTALRAERVAGTTQIDNPYELLKNLTRGKRLTADDLAVFVEGLEMSESGKARLRALTPATYTGVANQLVDYLN
ncbi:adenylosuccinate lyase [Microbacteriaceae bacterium MWH-Ta3]|nr:adenylosuccinate lyase [Microbacteriaceae bacterium MWH-Ta3]